MDKLLTIGEVAKLVGVSVQTLRHYDQLGLLRPSRVTEAGYRLYSQADCARLELLRTLRGLGFDLSTIAGLLKGELSPAEAVQLQLQALELQVRTLQRQQVVLRAVLKGDAQAVLARLNRMQALAGLDKLERESFLATHLKKGLGGQTGNPQVWRAAVLDLPEEMSEAQLEAWLELAEIAISDEFQRALHNQMHPPKNLSKAPEEWERQVQILMGLCIETVRAKRSPTSKASQAMLEAWLGALAKNTNRKTTQPLAEQVLHYFATSHSPKMDRYWELVAKLKGWEYTPIYAQAVDWLLQGLRCQVETMLVREGVKKTVSHRSRHPIPK